MKKYKIGFSIKGFVAFLCVMIPNIIWAVLPPTNDILAGNNADNPIFDVLLNICRFLIFALLVLLINKTEKENRTSKALLCLSVFCLLGYFVSWVLYYLGNTNPWLLVLGLAASPSLYFIFIGLWLKNYPVILPSFIFAIIHIAITYANFVQF